MIGPLVDPPLLLALPVGFLFGALLERGGLASSRTIADQLTGRDFTVMKVMLAAIVTAMLGVFWATRLGWLDLSRVAIPATDLLPQAIGAVVFGAGFAIAALCPGTACASAGTGRLDGLAAVAGLLIGTAATMLAWPSLGVVAERAPRDAAQLPADLGIPTGMVVAVITLAAVLGLPLLSRLEGTPSGRTVTPLGTVALTLGLLAIPAASRAPSLASAELAVVAREIARESDHVEALDLAEWIRDGVPGLRVIDVRDDLDAGAYVIPGSERVPAAMVVGLEIRPDERVVLYSDGGVHAAQAWVLLRTLGIRNVFVLHDGLAAWEDDVLSPMPPRPGDPADSTRWVRARAASAYFGGMPRSARVEPETAAPRSRRRNTC